MQKQDSHKRILITGATGYVGGRLLKRLEQREDLSLRCLARRPEYLRARVSQNTEVVAGDVMDKDSLLPALKGVHSAYYLIHSMGSEKDFEELDRQAAQNFGEAAEACGVQRIIYLGGLGDSSIDLSPHLRSRQEVGRILRSYDPNVIELRASIVLGSGSLSFEMIRTIVERLPVMVTPRWVSVKAQPIGISDLLDYLVASLDLPLQESRVFEIGGTDAMSYGDLMREYARQRGLRRMMIPVPVLSPRLSSLWLGLVTPLYARVGRKLIDSIQHPTVVTDESAGEAFDIEPESAREAIAAALHNEDQEIAETRWSDALSASGPQSNYGGIRFGSRLLDSRTATVDASAAEAFKPIKSIGGKTGWYYANWLWHIRGFLDLLVGGVGMRRGRRHPEKIRVGDVIDWWRVEAYEPNHLLRLLAEMKVPGRAWLEFEVTENDDGTTIRQTAVFDPNGLWGLVYWYGVYPLHSLVFAGMLKGIVAACEEQANGEQS